MSDTHCIELFLCDCTSKFYANSSAEINHKPPDFKLKRIMVDKKCRQFGCSFFDPYNEVRQPLLPLQNSKFLYFTYRYDEND